VANKKGTANTRSYGSITKSISIGKRMKEARSRKAGVSSEGMVFPLAWEVWVTKSLGSVVGRADRRIAVLGSGF